MYLGFPYYGPKIEVRLVDVCELEAGFMFRRLCVLVDGTRLVVDCVLLVLKRRYQRLVLLFSFRALFPLPSSRDRIAY